MFSRSFTLLFKNFKSKIRFEKRTVAKIKLDEFPKPVRNMNIAVIGANSNVGQISALLLKEQLIFKNIILYDTVDTQGIACELNHINTRPKVQSFCGIKNLEAVISNSRIVYICDGLQTFPGISEKHLFEKNAQKVRQIIMYCAEFNPHAMVVIASPPIDCLVPMAIEEFKKADIIANKRVFGLARTYVSRSNALAGLHLNINPSKANCFVVGGNYRRTCIPVLSQMTHGQINRASNEMLTRRIQEAEEDVLHEKKNEGNNQGCYLSTALCGVKFVTALAEALNGNTHQIECAYVKQDKPMDEYARYLTTLVTLGKDGVESYHVPKLSELEKSRLKLVTDDIRYNIHMGESFITGEDRITAIHRPKKEKPKKKPPCKAIEEKVKEKEECKEKKPLKTMRIAN